MTTVEDRINDLLQSLQNETERTMKLVDWMKQHQATLEKIGCVPVIYLNYIDFNNPSREQTLQIIQAFPGAWDKALTTLEGDKINYTRRDPEPNGLTPRIWATEPPPCCVLVEETVVVPEHTETRRRVVCPEPMEAA